MVECEAELQLAEARAQIQELLPATDQATLTLTLTPTLTVTTTLTGASRDGCPGRGIEGL